MDLEKYIQNPTCLWDFSTTKTLVELKWAALRSQGRFQNTSEYSTAAYLSKRVIPDVRRMKLDFKSQLNTYLEGYDEEYLSDFYSQNHLVPLDHEDFERAQAKLNKALSIFDYPGGPLQSLNLLVRSIHVVKQDDPEIDISHSDPQIPFSIFVSVCENESPFSDLRIAEGVLHEAMHLKLSLLEDVTQLVKPYSGNLYFSPWRDERRPAQGVLHGLFVFKAIIDFYCSLSKDNLNDFEISYLADRKAQIASEIKQLNEFPSCIDLTVYGANLVKNLLP